MLIEIILINLIFVKVDNIILKIENNLKKKINSSMQENHNLFIE